MSVTEPTDLVSVFKDGDTFPVDDDTKRRIELVDRAAVRRVLDELDRVRVSRDFELYPGYTIREFVRLMREGLE